MCWVVLFEEPDGNGFAGVKEAGVRALAVGAGGLVWQGEDDLFGAPGWQDAVWTDVSIPGGPDLFDVYGYKDEATEEEVFYVVGGNEVWIRRGDADWEQEIPTMPGALLSVMGSAANAIWAAGTNGLIMHWDGVSWDQTELDSGAQLNGIFVYGTGQAWGAGTEDMWFGGGEGYLLRWRP